MLLLKPVFFHGEGIKVHLQKDTSVLQFLKMVFPIQALVTFKVRQYRIISSLLQLCQSLIQLYIGTVRQELRQHISAACKCKDLTSIQLVCQFGIIKAFLPGIDPDIQSFLTAPALHLSAQIQNGLCLCLITLRVIMWRCYDCAYSLTVRLLHCLHGFLHVLCTVIDPRQQMTVHIAYFQCHAPFLLYLLASPARYCPLFSS